MESYDAKKNTTEVRQGSRRLGNFRVLIIALVLLIVAFGVVYFVTSFHGPATGN